MKSIFEPATRTEIINRIDTLSEKSRPIWGEMSVAQMVRHCAICEEYYYGNVKVDRSFIGRIFGKRAIKGILKNENSAIGKNAPTAVQFKVKEVITDLDAEKIKWKSLIAGYGSFDQNEFVHWFFGKLTKEQLGQFIYKHCDHHLRQFGV